MTLDELEQRERANAAERRLGTALKFVDYIAKRYEEGWDEPVTENFYNEARALLDEWGRALAASAVERHAQERFMSEPMASATYPVGSAGHQSELLVGMLEDWRNIPPPCPLCGVTASCCSRSDCPRE